MSSESSKSFNPYHRWLGISAKDCPPNHYRLLGIDEFESDEDVIESAADRQMKHVRSFQSGKNGQLSQQILNELSAAKVCLFNPEKKAEYDRQLRARNAQKEAAEKPAQTAVVKPSLRTQTPVAIPQTPQPAPVVSTQTAFNKPAAKPAFPATAFGQGARPTTQSAGKPNGMVIAGIAAAFIVFGAVVIIGVVSAFVVSSDEQVAEQSSDPNEKVQVNDSTKGQGAKTSTLKNKQSENTQTESKLAISQTGVETKKSAAEPETKQSVQSEAVGALLDVKRMKIVPFGQPEQLPNKPSSAYRFDWITKPRTSDKNGVLEFSVEASGVVYLVTTTEYQGNPSGSWSKDRVTKQQLIEQGWTDLGKCPWKQKESLLERDVTAGEQFSIRMNKYWPPALIVPGPLASEAKTTVSATKTGSTEVSSDAAVLKGTYVLRLGNEGGIELADTKGFLHPDRHSTIEFWARFDGDAQAMNLINDRVLGNKYPELDNQEGGLIVRIDRRGSGQLWSSIATRSGGGNRRFELEPNEWSHLAFSNDTEKLRFFVNGKLIGDRDAQLADWLPGPLNVHIGFHRFLFFSIRHGFNGDLRDVRFSTVCRYQDEFSPPGKFTLDDDTELLLKFTDPGSDRIEDISGNDHHATITGGEWLPAD